MACKTSFELHHHFPKLAEEAGFTFNTHRPRIHIDWNKIKLIDIDSLIKERKFGIIEQHLNDILDCVFESEFDVRILDEGVMKMFRLAQLAVEYQQFCRHYLDRSVYVLREEITSLAQELDTCKKDLREKDEEIRRLRKRSRHSFKNSLPYGNENIASMILKTLSQKSDSTMFMSPLNDSLMQYNKCKYCDKVFLNQLYLKSHIARRHPNIMETPQKDTEDRHVNIGNPKLSAEVTELRNKIKDMEIMMANSNEKVTSTNIDNDNKNDIQDNKKVMKDAEVATNNEEYLLSKIQEWKKQELENYNKEIYMLRNEIMETINAFKVKENQKAALTEPNIIEQLHETIKQQGAEISALKKELIDSKIRTETECNERSKEAEAQVTFWANRAEVQSKQYELLLQKLNDVAKDAKESRALAEAEKERASQLKDLLQQSLTFKINEGVESTDEALTPENIPSKSIVRKKERDIQTDSNKSQQEPDLNHLAKLHRKAQELLQVASTTSSSSDISSIEHSKPIKVNNTFTRSFVSDKATNNIVTKQEKMNGTKSQQLKSSVQQKPKKMVNGKGPKVQKQIIKPIYTKTVKKINIPNATPASPKKLVRAKITEEVNSRLVSVGVDPLKPRLSQIVFQRQRSQLQQHQELKAKKNPARDKVRHSILAFLDTNTTDFKNEVTQAPDYISPTKVKQPFKNLSSVISNVKTKALALVKLKELNGKEKPGPRNAEVAKRAMSLLKTPPGSAVSSPKITKRSPLKTFNVSQKYRQTTVGDSPLTPKKMKRNSNSNKPLETTCSNAATMSNSEESDHNYYNTRTVQQSSKSIDTLIKSPARRPASATADNNYTVQKYTLGDNNLLRTQSVTNLIEHTSNLNEIISTQSLKLSPSKNNDNSSDDAESLITTANKKNVLENLVENTLKQTKSVLRNASSTSSLNKKKVLFDMDAIQMKSVSASPSQSLTEKSDGNEKFELGLVNLESEEWDISSIENEPLKNDTKIQNVTRTSPKIAELKEKIESQLARRNETPHSALVGGIDVLAGTLRKTGSIAGSNTSLGSSILDDTESVPIVNHKTLVKPMKVIAKDDSDIDISEFSIDRIVHKNESF